MDHNQALVETIYAGWRTYQGLLTSALKPLTPEQLALQTAPSLRSIEAIATHMIGARARWFAPPLGDGNKKLASFGRWDRRGGSVRNASEIVLGLEATLESIHDFIQGWSPAGWAERIPGEFPGDPEFITRPWVIWHLIEHDLHHGGEISLTLGIHGLTAPNL